MDGAGDGWYYRVGRRYNKRFACAGLIFLIDEEGLLSLFSGLLVGILPSLLFVVYYVTLLDVEEGLGDKVVFEVPLVDIFDTSLFVGFQGAFFDGF